MGKQSLIKLTASRHTNNAGGDQLTAMALSRIKPNPWNTKSRSRYCGREFEELVASIEKKGLIQPVVVRPVEETGGVDHEIVCGERRFKACLAIAGKNGGPAKNTILSLVRRLTDDEAFDLTIIENLQRQDLNPLEEAQSFKQFLQKRGDDAAADLADRIGVSESYIRRRVAVLDLPQPALKAWQRGQMTYGHLEQLRRLKDKKQIARFVAQIVHRASGGKSWEGAMTVRELKHDIDMESPSLKTTIFDQKKAGCRQCYSNSSVQKKLFASDEDEDLKCLNPKCYKQQVNNHLLAHWEEEFKPQYGTNGFVFESAISWNDYEAINGKIRAACKKCPHLVTVVEMDGSVQSYRKRVCNGDKACFKGVYRAKSSASDDADPQSTAQAKAETRAANHGTEFRELFYAEALPKKFMDLVSGHLAVLQATVIAFSVIHWEVSNWIRERLGMNEIEDHWNTDKFLEKVFALNDEQADKLLHELAIDIVMKHASPVIRRALADRIGIDLAAEWAITEAYLKKKTIAEMLAMGKELEIFEDDQVMTYTVAAHGHTNFHQLKKAELMKVFLQSGIDLTGKVPEEILA